MGTRLFGAAALAIAVTAWGTPRSAFVVGSAAQDHAAEHPAQAQRPNMMDMQKTHAEMMADMKAGDAKLDALVKEMNAAAGDARADAVAAVVNELVRQQGDARSNGTDARADDGRGARRDEAEVEPESRVRPDALCVRTARCSPHTVRRLRPRSTSGPRPRRGR